MINFLKYLVLMTLSASSFAATTVTVDPRIRADAWDGWGTCLSWWAKSVGEIDGVEDPAIREQACQYLFSESGLDMSIVRYEIGCYPTPDAQQPPAGSMDRGYREQVESYLQVDHDGFRYYDWDADYGQRWILKRAKELGVKHFQAWACNAPWFMMQPIPPENTIEWFMPPKEGEWTNYLDYLMTVIVKFRDDPDFGNIYFESLEPANEVDIQRDVPDQYNWIGPDGNWARLSQMIEETDAARTRYDVDTIIAFGDYANSGSSWLQQYFTDEAKHALGRVQVHSYGRSFSEYTRAWADSVARPLWQTEWITYDYGPTLIRTIFDDIQQLKVTAWLYWESVCEDAWGLVTGKTFNPGELTSLLLTKKYYAFGHLSKFIKEGYHFMPTSDTNSLMAINPDECELVIVSINFSDNPENKTYDLSKFDSVQPGMCYTTDRMDTWNAAQGVNQQQTAISPAGSSLHLNADSWTIKTIVLPVSYTGEVFDSFYLLENKATGKAVQAPPSLGEEVFEAQIDRTDLRQHWRIEGNAQGNTALRSRTLINQCLALNGDWVKTRIDELRFENWWSITDVMPSGDGHYFLVKHTPAGDKYMTSKADGSLSFELYQSLDHQKWAFIPARIITSTSRNIELSVSFPESTAVGLSWAGIDGESYTVETNGNLSAGGWRPYMTGIPGAGTNISIEVPIHEDMLFYQVFSE